MARGFCDGRAWYAEAAHLSLADAPEFPISALLPQILASLAAHPRLVLEAPPGAGKTTQVPLALLDAPWLATAAVLMLEPRRVAARAAAGFMAKQLGEAVGRHRRLPHPLRAARSRARTRDRSASPKAS